MPHLLSWSAPFDKVHPFSFLQLSHPPPAASWSAPFDKVQPLPSSLPLWPAPFGKVQNPAPFDKVQPLAPFDKVQSLPFFFILHLHGRCSPIPHWFFFWLALWSSFAFARSVEVSRNLSLSSQAFLYLSLLALDTVPLPAALPLLFLSFIALLPRAHCSYPKQHSYDPFAKGSGKQYCT